MAAGLKALTRFLEPGGPAVQLDPGGPILLNEKCLRKGGIFIVVVGRAGFEPATNWLKALHQL